MNLLFVCDQYPPFDRGGYAQLCFDLAGELRKIGNTVAILCEKPRIPHSQLEDEPVFRELIIPNEYNESIPIPIQQIFYAPFRRARNEKILRIIAEKIGAEAIVFWPNTYGDPNLWLSALQLPNMLVSFYVAGVSPQFSIVDQYWSFPGSTKWIKRIKSIGRLFMAGGSPPINQRRLKHIMCVSEFERNRMIDEGIPSDEIVVINNGIDLQYFPFRGLPSAVRDQSMLRLIYAGRLDQEKGAHTIIEALACLKHNYPKQTKIDLTILGTGASDYEIGLRSLVEQLNISEYVDFHDWIPRDQVPAFLNNYDILVLPTIRAESLARVTQEAMALGLIVVATPTGGTPELVQDGKTGLIFPADSPEDLAACIFKLVDNLQFCDELAEAARKLVTDQFTMQRMSENVMMQLHVWKNNGRN